MSEHAEKRKQDEDAEEFEAESSSVDDESSEDESSDDENMEQVQADFEAYPPSAQDREGIQALLRQLFKKEPIELGLLSEHLIEEQALCIVIKQMIDGQVDEEDEDVFSLSALLQLNKQELIKKPFIKLITNFLIRTAKEHNSKKLLEILEDVNVDKTLILNERFINLPPKLGVISLENLLDEAKNANSPISNLIVICKLLKAKDDSSSLRKANNKRFKSTDDCDLIYLNGEDEVFSENALEKYEFKIVDDDSDTTVQRNWKSGQKFIPYRRILLLDMNGLKKSFAKLKEEAHSNANSS